MSKFMFLTRYEDEEKILVNLDNVLYMKQVGIEHTATKVFFVHDEDNFIAVTETLATIVMNTP
tara:strand:+ start:104 stop:292 length:189 start_codon:yes stop_codon:yes gene_type:complete